jgi:CheY-like chemotaxis protein
MQGQAIMVVDDDPEVRHLLELVLRETLDLSPILAENGREALAKAERSQPCLVLMDLTMPEVNGLAATRALKSSPATKAIRIIGMSGTLPDWMALVEGCDDFIAKPFDLDDLIAKVKRHLSEARKQAA